MRKIRIGQLTEQQLNCALACVVGLEVERNGSCLVTDDGATWEPTRRWSQLGPLLEKFDAELFIEPFSAFNSRDVPLGRGGRYMATVKGSPAFADTQKKAVALAIVSSELGSEITLPDWI